MQLHCYPPQVAIARSSTTQENNCGISFNRRRLLMAAASAATAQPYPVHDACRSHNRLQLKHLIEQGESVNTVNDFDETPLCVSITQHDLEIVKLLVQQNANVNFRNLNENETILSLAIREAVQHSDLSILRYLLSKGADPNMTICESFLYYPLHYACGLNSLEVVKCLVEFGADIRAVTGTGNTCLHLYYAGVGIVQYFIEHGLNVNRRNSFLETPLHVHSYNWDNLPKQDVIDVLLHHGADIHAIDSWGQNALIRGAKNGLTDGIVQRLVKEGIDVNHKDVAGRTAMHEAAGYSSSTDIINYFHSCGASVNLKDEDGLTPLLYCLRYSSWAYVFNKVKCFIELGAQMSVTNQDVESSLMLACQEVKFSVTASLQSSFEGCINTAQYLLERSVPIVNIRAKSGNTPLNDIVQSYKKCGKHFSDVHMWRSMREQRQSQLFALIQHLVTSGAHVDVPNQRNKSVVDIVCQDSINPLLREYVRDMCLPLRLSCLSACIVGRHFGRGINKTLDRFIPAQVQALIDLHAPTTTIKTRV